MACIGCGRGFHWECFDHIEGQGNCCCDKEITTAVSKQFISPTGGGYKADDEITESAGRKRAAVLYPIDPEEYCEWRLQANCGGGKYPVTGCLTGKQQNRHHGPDKKTSNNNENNVHLICANCHNLWHAANDAHYTREEYALLIHSPRPATTEELLLRGKS